MAKLVGRPTPPAGAPSQTVNRPPRRPHTLVLSIAHGDLRLAKYPLAVGHYHGDTIVHAEKRLDIQLKGRLTEFFNLFLYPGPAGTFEFINVPDARPPGALIIGLGDVGELKSSIVRNGVCNAALRYVLRVLNDARNKQSAAALSAKGSVAPPQSYIPIGISSLLVGTYGGNALSIAGSLSAIVQGVVQANEALRLQELWDKVRISEVQIVELYEDVTREAMRAAVYLKEHPPSYLVEGDALQVEPMYISPLGSGRTQRPIDPYTRGWWRRISITYEEGKDGEEGLRFLSLTDRARAEETLQHTQRKLIEKAVKQAVEARGDTDELSTMLFKLLFPNSIKEQASAETDLVFVLDSQSAQYPWELLAERTRNGVEPLAVRMGLIRQFKTADFALNPQPARDMNALVIGPPNSGEIPLPKAREEAEQVAEILQEAGYKVGEAGEALLDADSLQVMGRLFAKSYKIIHLAGHGKYVAGKPAESGMILDDGTLLTSMELSNLDPLPELVFINCCHLGMLDDGTDVLVTNSPHALAASVSEELIKKGVKAVVAAGWAVNDAAAKAFAEKFYKEMLQGQKFGEAVKNARQAARAAVPNSNTWGAYQCYGNPDFVLERAGDGSERAQRDTRCYSQREYLEKLADFKADATRADNDAIAALRLQLEEIANNIPSIWRNGAMLRALGDAWAALGIFDKAIENYKQAAFEDKAEAPLNTIEQLANLLSSYADELSAPTGVATSNGSRKRSPRHFMDEAQQRLNWLFELGETSERLSLMGSYFKRKALATQKHSEQMKYLRSAEEYYGKAHRLHKKSGAVKAYPALNWLTIRFLLGLPLKGARKLIDECQQTARKDEQNEPSIWNRVTEADAELLLHLTQGDLEETVESVTALYQRAFAAGATQRQLSSVVKNFDFLRLMLSGMALKSEAAAKNVRALEKLQAAFSPVN